MANDLTNRPWVIDSTGVLTTDRLRLRGIRWVGATTAAHVAELKDSAGRVVWSSVAGGGNNVEADSPTFDVLGLQCTTLASGKLYVEYA